MAVHPIDARKERILHAIIDDYIQTAMPVGSRTISRKYETSLSSATIRNEMSDLEELGYLAQPHVSAGRVPSVKAYRLYVDDLLEDQLPRPDTAGQDGLGRQVLRRGKRQALSYKQLRNHSVCADCAPRRPRPACGPRWPSAGGGRPPGRCGPGFRSPGAP